MKNLLKSKADRIAIILGGFAFTACLLGTGIYFTFVASPTGSAEIDRLEKLPDLTAGNLASVSPGEEYIVTGILEGNEPQIIIGFVAYYTETWGYEKKYYFRSPPKLQWKWYLSGIGMPPLTITLDDGPITTAEVPLAYPPSNMNLSFSGDLHEQLFPAESGLAGTYEGELLYEGSVRTRGFLNGDLVTIHARINAEGEPRPLHLHGGTRASMFADMRQRERVVPTTGIIMMAVSLIPLVIAILTIRVNRRLKGK
jgi:hypothetical protein